MAAYKKGGCAVIDNAAKTPTPIYYFAYTAKQSENVDAEADMTRIAGMLNVIEGDVADERLKETARTILKQYEYLKIKQDGNK